MYSVSQKSSPPETFCHIFTPAKYISVKFCHCISTHIYQFWSIYVNVCSKMTLIIQGVLIVFTVSVSSFTKSNCSD